MIAIAATLLALASSPALALQIYVSNEKDNTVTVIDGTTLEVLKTIKTARRPRGIIASPDGKEVYVACGDGDIIDVSTPRSSRSSANSTPAPILN
ncbi:MAG: hypothetical protein ACXWVQ_09245 [Methyloceanibacter sp.]